MADVGINATQLSDPQGQGASVVKPVETPVQRDLITPFVGQVASIFREGMQNERKNKAEEFKQAVLKEYASKQDALNQSLSTGEKSAEFVAAQSKMLFSKYLAGYSQFGTEIKQLRDSFVSGTQLSDAEAALKEKRDIRSQILQGAAKDGLVYPGMSPESEEAVIKHFQTQQKARAELNDRITQNTENRTQTKYEMDVNDYTNKRRSFQLVNEIAGTSLDALRAEANDLRALITKDPQMFTQAQAQLGTRIARINASLQAAAGVNPELAAPYRALMDQYSSSILKGLDPKESSDVLKNIFETAQMRIKLAMSQDPEVASAIAISDLFQNNAVSVFQASQVVTRALALGSGVPLDQNERIPVLVGTADEKKALDSLKESIKGMSGKDAVAAQASNTVNHFFLHIGKLITEGADPSKLANIVDFTSSPEFLKLVNEGKIDNNAKNQVTRAIQQVWEKTAIEGVSKVFYGPIFQGTNFYDQLYSTYGDKKVSDIVNVTFNGSGIAFTPKVPAKSPKDIEAQNRVIKSLEASAAVVNKMIQSGAHLGGSADYAKMWEQVKPMLFPTLAVKGAASTAPKSSPKPAAKLEEPAEKAATSDDAYIEKALQLLLKKDPNMNIDYVRNAVKGAEPERRQFVIDQMKNLEGKQ